VYVGITTHFWRQGSNLAKRAHQHNLKKIWPWILFFTFISTRNTTYRFTDITALKANDSNWHILLWQRKENWGLGRSYWKIFGTTLFPLGKGPFWKERAPQKRALSFLCWIGQRSRASRPLSWLLPWHAMCQTAFFVVHREYIHNTILTASTCAYSKFGESPTYSTILTGSTHKRIKPQNKKYVILFILWSYLVKIPCSCCHFCCFHPHNFWECVGLSVVYWVQKNSFAWIIKLTDFFLNFVMLQ